MSIALAEFLTAVLGVYALAGVVFASYFVIAGAKRIDPNAEAMPWRARAVIFPGAAGLWPLLLVKLTTGKPSA